MTVQKCVREYDLFYHDFILADRLDIGVSCLQV